ncbi:MAG TPA: glycosyltransferase, partial [Terriglobales bacterium]|nr:glycosyltransferase [Terriglobales bacterium]
SWIEQLARISADLVWVGKGAWALPWFWQELKRREPFAKLVCYNADNPIVTYSRGGNRLWVTESIPYFDYYCTYNGSLVEPLKRAGAKKVIQSPFAWDPWLHPAEVEICQEDRERYACDVMFVGNGDEYREKWLENIMEAAEPYKWQFHVYGCWNPRRGSRVMQAIRGAQIYGLEMVKAVRAARISINVLRAQNEGSHNMRTFEIPGCRGLMASQFSAEQNEFFKGGEAAIYFKNPGEAVAKIADVISQEAKLKNLVAQAHEIARQNTYVHRAKSLIDAIRAESSTPMTLSPRLNKK